MDHNRSVIPVGRNGILIDGAHRVAIAAYYNFQIPIVRLPIDGTPMDVTFFKKRMLSSEDLDYYCRELINWREGLFLCCLWPSAAGVQRREEAVRYIREKGQIVYRKSIEITDNGLYNLIPQIYLSKDWVGSANDRFLSATPKVNNCKGNADLDVILFQYEGLDGVLKLKEKMRSVFGIKENSLHISDYQNETKFLADMLLHVNTVEFLNKGEPFKYVELNRRIFNFQDRLQKRSLSLDDFIIDSSSIMGLYGIRQPADLDYLSIEGLELFTDDDKINLHTEELSYYGRRVDDLIYNPENHIRYMGLKFITLDVLADFKHNRGKKKDKDDEKLIKACINNKKNLKAYISKAKISARRTARNAAFKFLHILPKGGYEKARDVYHIIRGRKQG